MSVIESGRCGEIYHISTVQEEVTIARLVQMICTKMGKSFENAVNSIDENFGQEAWDPEGICMVLMANDESENTALPSDYRISNNYPNPFNPTTEMEFSLPIESDISFSVYSLTGEEIYSYDRSSVPGGNYKITWNGKNRSGFSVPSGVYLYEFRAGNEFRQVKKMTLLK